MGIRDRVTRASRAAALMALLAGAAAAGEPACRADQVQLRGDWGTARFTVELADDKAEQAQGLMNRESLPQAAGMLFVYPHTRNVGFWMKDTLIPLDMIFIDATGTVARVHSNATPGDRTPIMAGSEVKAVLEINGGLAQRLGIAPGTQLRHPAFETDRAAWGC